MLLIFLTFSFGVLVIVTALCTRDVAADAFLFFLSFACIIFIFVLIKISRVNDFAKVTVDVGILPLPPLPNE